MRKIAFGILVFVFIAGLMLLSRRDAARAALNPESAASSQGPPEAGEIADLNAPLEEERSEAQAAPSPEAALTREVAAEETTGSLLCIVHGILADESGAPLEGVLVRLQAHKVWSSGVDVPRLEHEKKYKLVGFEQFTDSAGAFRFEAPAPTVSITWMDIEPTRFLDSRRITFNSSQARFEPSLTAGERDLGEIRLATTGAISGRVTAEDGTPLADVRMGIGPDPSTTYGKNTRTGPDGRYVLGHAPIGSYCITADLKGYVSGVLQPVTVESQRDTTPIDFALKEAPTLRGRVVDENGRALEGARLYGWPKSSGSGAGATTEPDGRFTVPLPQEEPYSLEATLKGHAKWESEEGLYFEPGTTDLEIVLESIPLTRFVVVDADSGVPVQEFGINILLDNGSKAPQRVYTERRRPRVLAHENGVAEVTAREGFDVYVISAPGYGLAVGEVAFDDPSTPVQTIRLVPGATVSGRILREGKPVPGVTIQLVRGNSFFGGEFTPEANTQVIRQTDSEGRFIVDSLSVGKYRFRATPAAGALLELPTFPLELRETKDLGDLELPLSSARIEGEVLVPPGIDPAGLRVAAGSYRDGLTALVDQQGSFLFDNLPEGPLTLRLLERPGSLAGGASVSVQCAAGETTLATLDARDRGVCELQLSLDFGPLPTEGFIVEVVNANNDLESSRLTECDAEGRTQGTARGWGDTVLHVWLPDGRTLELRDLDLELRAGERVEKLIQAEFARVRFSLPPGTELPRDGQIELDLEPLEPEDPGYRVDLERKSGRLLEASPWAGETGEEIFIDGLPSGAYRYVFEIQDSSQAAGSSSSNAGTALRSEGEILLVSGEEVPITLP